MDRQAVGLGFLPCDSASLSLTQSENVIVHGKDIVCGFDVAALGGHGLEQKKIEDKRLFSYIVQ